MAKQDELTPIETPEGLQKPGRIQKAPENFLTPTEVEQVTKGRRDFHPQAYQHRQVTRCR